MWRSPRPNWIPSLLLQIWRLISWLKFLDEKLLIEVNDAFFLLFFPVLIVVEVSIAHPNFFFSFISQFFHECWIPVVYLHSFFSICFFSFLLSVLEFFLPVHIRHRSSSSHSWFYCWSCCLGCVLASPHAAHVAVRPLSLLPHPEERTRRTRAKRSGKGRSRRRATVSPSSSSATLPKAPSHRQSNFCERQKAQQGMPFLVAFICCSCCSDCRYYSSSSSWTSLCLLFLAFVFSFLFLFLSFFFIFPLYSSLFLFLLVVFPILQTANVALPCFSSSSISAPAWACLCLHVFFVLFSSFQALWSRRLISSLTITRWSHRSRLARPSLRPIDPLIALLTADIMYE